MDLALVYVALIVLLAVASGRPRISRWRGPGASSLEEVQEEHLRLFRNPRDRGEE